MDPTGWLQSIGLERYAAAFRENEIDETVLPHLTAEDLKDIGVGPVGHRRKLLDAIAYLLTDAEGEAPTEALSQPSLWSQVSGERRQVTVMFADLVGSTGLSARMDLEDLREVISAYQKCVSETVRGFGGFVAKYLGDGVLVYFGYPEAHEDDAARAVQAGLELIKAVTTLNSPVLLQARVGIATGLVVVGDSIELGQSRERDIFGEAPNVAARLQEVARPNTVIIAESTRRLLGDLFELEDLGGKDLKGFPERVPAWAVHRASLVESRFHALRTSGLTALVGREEEIEILLRRWSKAKSGQGQVVLLSGEPGIGKSRLTAVLRERLAAEPHMQLRYYCSPQHTDSALYPIIERIQRAAGLTLDEGPKTKLDKLDAILARTSTSSEDASLIAEMLSLPNDGRYPTFDLTPEQRRGRTLAALTAQIISLTRRQPVLIVLEDAHWSDPTTLEMVGRVVNRIVNLRALLIVTCRPEFKLPWIGQSHVTTLIVNRLTRLETNAMIEWVAGNTVIPPNIQQEIIERTDGIPLFVEEITKAVMEANSQRATELPEGESPDSIEHKASVVPASVPASLHASLTARLDRLGSAKEIAQIGSVIGREFSYALLAAVARRSEAELQLSLNRLVEAGLLFRQGLPPHASYLFKHALVQNAAYASLVREPLRALHARIAEILESQFADIAENQPELLARHFTEAGLVDKAAHLWGKAGQRSLARSALAEAAEQLTWALTQMATLPSTPALRREEIRLQVALITPLLHIKGYAAPETQAATERARVLIEQAEALGERLEDPLLLLSVVYGFWVAKFVAFNGDTMRDFAGYFQGLAEKQETTAPKMIGDRIVGTSLLLTGDIREGRAHLDRTLAVYDPAEHRQLATRFGQDVRVSALCYRALGLWMLGYSEAALADTNRALKDAREIGQAATLMFMLSLTSFTHIFYGDYAAANALADELIISANEKGALYWKAQGMSHHGCVLALTGEAAAAVQMISSGTAAWRSTGATLWTPLWLSYLAKAYADLEKFDDAWRCMDDAKIAVTTTKERWYEAELYRMAGELALKRPRLDVKKAQVNFDHALTIARAQHAKSWELRAAMSTARLWRDQGRRSDALDLVAPIYARFTEGFDSLDLKEAKALLGALNA